MPAINEDSNLKQRTILQEGEDNRRPLIPGWILNLDYLLTGVIFAVLVLVTAWGVIRRYALGDPISWLEEVQLMLFVSVIYLGAGSAFRSYSHIGIEFLVDRFTGTPRKILEAIISVIVVVVLVYFVFRGFDVVQMMAWGNRTSNILNIPYALTYAVLPIGCGWMIINFLLVRYFGAGDREDTGEAAASAKEVADK